MKWIHLTVSLYSVVKVSQSVTGAKKARQQTCHPIPVREETFSCAKYLRSSKLRLQHILLVQRKEDPPYFLKDICFSPKTDRITKKL